MEFFSEWILLSILVVLVMKKTFDHFAKQYEHIPHDKIVPFLDTAYHMHSIYLQRYRRLQRIK